MVQPRLKFWGWGYEGDVLSPDEVRWLESAWAKQFRIPQFDLTSTPAAEEIRLRPPRLTIPAATPIADGEESKLYVRPQLGTRCYPV